MKWKGKTAIVTGAGSGIGRAIAGQLGAMGMRVACCGRRERALEETAVVIEKLGGDADIFPLDLLVADQVNHMVDSVIARWGTVDVLINNAGRHGSVGPLWTLDPDDWWADLEVNLLGTFHCCQQVLPQMCQQGTGLIVNISGGGDVQSRPFGSSYACSKAAVLRLTDSLAEELHTMGYGRVTVLAFNPGFTRTAMTEAIAASSEAAQWMPMFAERFRSGQVQKPEDAAERLVRFVSQAGPALSGRVFHIDDPLEAILDQQDSLADEDFFLRRRS